MPGVALIHGLEDICEEACSQNTVWRITRGILFYMWRHQGSRIQWRSGADREVWRTVWKGHVSTEVCSAYPVRKNYLLCEPLYHSRAILQSYTRNGHESCSFSINNFIIFSCFFPIRRRFLSSIGYVLLTVMIILWNVNSHLPACLGRNLRILRLKLSKLSDIG